MSGKQTEDERALLLAIREAGDDDTPRLAFADWLEEGRPATNDQNQYPTVGDLNQRQRDAERAGFIRAQVAAERLPAGDPRRAALEQRAGALLQAHPEWAGGLGKQLEFRRGFPQDATLSAQDFLKHSGEPALATITYLRIYPCNPEELAKLLASPRLDGITALHLEYNDIGNEGAEAVAASPHLHNLEKLSLSGNDIGNEGAQALAASPHLGNLRWLHLGVNRITGGGAQALAASPHLHKLERLFLTGDRIGNEGVQALAASPHLQNITHLHLGMNGVGAAGARALADSPHLQNLIDLDLAGNDIGNTVLQQIEERMRQRRKCRQPGGRGSSA